MPFYERQPFIQPLPSMLQEVMGGEIQVPRFQREGTEDTWTAEQRGDLLDSVYRGFPIGTILLWTTDKDIGCRQTVGGYQVEAPAIGRPRRLLLDGHQRLSTLVGILGPGVQGAQPDRCTWDEMWYFDLGDSEDPDRRSRDRFILAKDRHEPEPTHLPLRIVLDRVALNRWVRECDLTDEQLLLSDSLRDRFREYNLPVAVLAADSLREATESFKRINSSGTPMDDFHMVAALAFGPGVDVKECFNDLREELLAPAGWHSLADSDVLRVCAGLVPRQHPSKLQVDTLARALAKDPNLVRRAFEAVATAAELLADWGIHGPGALPYSWQLITLAIEVGRENGLDVQQAFHADAARRWFWRTTYGGVFAGVNSAVYDRASAALRQMANGGDDDMMRRDLSLIVTEVRRFDFRSVRSKASALVMARCQDDGDMSGAAHRALADRGASALQTAWSNGRRSVWYHLAIVPDPAALRGVRAALRAFAQGNASPEDQSLLTGLGFDPAPNTPPDKHLEQRRHRLLAQEQTFVKQLGLEWEAGEDGEPE